MKLSTWATVLDWYPAKTRKAILMKIPTKVLERIIPVLHIDFRMIFPQRTWSIEFLDRYLKPEWTDIWDHISIWYTLPKWFCEKHINWLNYHDLVHCQTLPKEFYNRHKCRVNWTVKK